MSNAGSSLMGIGQASGENKAIEAAKMAINSPLLELSIEGARGILFTITGGIGLSMSEVSEAAKVITASADEEAKIIFGAVIDEKMKDEIKITVVATGFVYKTGKREAEAKERIYTPSPFLSVEERKDEMKEFAVPERKKSKVSSLKQAQAEPARKKNDYQEEDDELSIPAFIRKKMM
jgi:cell division protein FtsZ